VNFLRNIALGVPVLLTIIASVLFVVFLHYCGLSWYLSVIDGIASAVLLMIVSFSGVQTINSYPTKVGLFFYSLTIGIVAAYITWMLNEVVIKWWLWHYPEYVQWFHETKYVRLFIYLLISGWILTHSALIRKTAVLEKQFKDIRDAATLHREAELFKLRQQLQQ
jgi:lysylphosphatidylglycerol synthetase-like protein (DUF2156 family)